MKTITLTFNKKPSYLVVKNIISEINLKGKLTNQQPLSRYGPAGTIVQNPTVRYIIAKYPRRGLITPGILILLINVSFQDL